MINHGLNEWINRIDNLRKTDKYLSKGRWTGYYTDDFLIKQGKYCLIRYKYPTIMVCHDDQNQCITLAIEVEKNIKLCQ